jgi:NADH-quinone oxidoreductase subunit N
MSGALMLLLAPVAGAAVVYALRRWPKPATGAAILFALFLVIRTTTISLVPATQGLEPAQTVFVLGRPLTLDAQLRLLMIFVYGSLLVLFVASWWIPQGRDFPAVALAVLSPLTAALMIQPFIFGAALLALAAAGLSLLIQSEQAGSAQASLRWLTVALLASCLLLVAGWALDEAANVSASTITFLFGISFLMLLVGFPFHIWVAPAMRRAASLVPVLVFGVIQVMVLVFCLQLLRDYPSVQAHRLFLQLVSGGGLLTVLVGAVLALVSGSVRQLPGYLMLINTGSVLMALAFPDLLGLQASVSLVLSRVLGLLLVGLASACLPSSPAGKRELLQEEPGPAQGRAQVYLSLALYVYGGLTLLGLPLTPGFGGQYATLALARSLSPWMAFGLVLALAGGLTALARHSVAFWAVAGASAPGDAPATPAGTVLGGLALLGSLLLAWFPQPLLAYADRLVRLF